MVMSAHCEHTKQIHGQTQGADKKKLTCVHLWRVQSAMLTLSAMDGAAKSDCFHSQALYDFKDDKYRYKDQEDAVGKTRKCFDATVAVFVVRVGIDVCTEMIHTHR